MTGDMDLKYEDLLLACRNHDFMMLLINLFMELHHLHGSFRDSTLIRFKLFLHPLLLPQIYSMLYLCVCVCVCTLHVYIYHIYIYMYIYIYPK